MLLMLCRQS